MVHASGALAVETYGLAKRFGATRAVDGLDLRVGRGTVHGILGPNGAGKTTTIRILATLLRPDAGVARVLGHDVTSEPAAVRRLISLTGQFASLDDDLTGAENLVVLARLRGFSGRAARARADTLLGACGLADAGGRAVKTYSGGMRRRLDVAASVITTPDVLFLDEPTTGLDPRSRNDVWSLIRGLAAEGTTVVLTTQQLDEADQLAHRISVIDRGRVIAEGSPPELKAATGAGTLRVRLRDAAERAEAERLLAETLAAPVRRQADPATISAPALDAEAGAVAIRRLFDAGIEPAEFVYGEATLDEAFLALTSPEGASGAETRRSGVA